jgi:16S rRNA (uracil1498-N3)-methyltransferase
VTAEPSGGGPGDGSNRKLAGWVFVEDLDGLELEPGDAHHLGRVLRLRPGQEVGASDGAGRWRPCRVSAAGAALRLEATGPVAAEPAPEPPVTIGFSLVKGDRPELVVQKLTELGVDRILLLAAARSVVRWDDARTARGMARLRQVAREAAMQSRRTRLPEVVGVTTVAEAATTLGESGGLCEQGGSARPSLRRPALLVGPEGGWDPLEVASGLPRVGLGPTTLRAETGAITAAVLLCALRSTTVREVSGGPHPYELGRMT